MIFSIIIFLVILNIIEGVKYIKKKENERYDNRVIKKLKGDIEDWMRNSDGWKANAAKAQSQHKALKIEFDQYKQRSPYLVASGNAMSMHTAIKGFCEFLFGNLELDESISDNSQEVTKRVHLIMDLLGHINISFNNAKNEFLSESFIPSVLNVWEINSLEQSMQDEHKKLIDFCNEYTGIGSITIEFNVTSNLSLDELFAVWHGKTKPVEGEVDPEFKEKFEALKDAKQRSELAVAYSNQENKFKAEIQTVKTELQNAGHGNASKFINLMTCLNGAFDKHLKSKQYPYSQAVALNNVLTCKSMDDLLKAMNALR